MCLQLWPLWGVNPLHRVEVIKCGPPGEISYPFPTLSPIGMKQIPN